MRIVFTLITLLSISVVAQAQGLSINNGQEFESKVVRRASNDNFKSYVDKKDRYRLDSKTNDYCNCSCVEYSIDESQDYSIEAKIEQVDANDERNFGIIFGFKDWDNYSLLEIDGSRNYSLISMYNGIVITHIKWTHSNVLRFGDTYNVLKIWKNKDKFLIVLNKNLVATVDAFKLSGTKHGFWVGGKGEFSIDNFYIKEFASPEDNIVTTKKDSTRNPSTKKTSSSDPHITASATGFVIDKRGYLATNYHVTEGASLILVCLPSNGEWKSYKAKVIKDDPINDLSIIKIDDSDFTPFLNLPYAMSFNTEDIAAEVFTLGYPQVQVMGVDVKYTTGVVNARTGIQGDPTHYQISTHVDHGNSGGPLFNSKGQIIGITDMGLDKAKYGEVNYAVKSTYLKILADAIPANIQLPRDNSIATKQRTEQIKQILPYVALILVAK